MRVKKDEYMWGIDSEDVWFSDVYDNIEECMEAATEQYELESNDYCEEFFERDDDGKLNPMVAIGKVEFIDTDNLVKGIFEKAKEVVDCGYFNFCYHSYMSYDIDFDKNTEANTKFKEAIMSWLEESGFSDFNVIIPIKYYNCVTRKSEDYK